MGEAGRVRQPRWRRNRNTTSAVAWLGAAVSGPRPGVHCSPSTGQSVADLAPHVDASGSARSGRAALGALERSGPRPAIIAAASAPRAASLGRGLLPPRGTDAAESLRRA